MWPIDGCGCGVGVPFLRMLRRTPKLGPPVVPFYPVLGEGSPTKIDYRNKGTPYSNLFTGGPRKGKCGTSRRTSFLADSPSRGCPPLSLGSGEVPRCAAAGHAQLSGSKGAQHRSRPMVVENRCVFFWGGPPKKRRSGFPCVPFKPTKRGTHKKERDRYPSRF